MYDVYAGVNSMAITGEAKDRLEVVGESIDIACLINRLRKKVYRADIVVAEEVKDKKKEEEEEEKEEEAKKIRRKRRRRKKSSRSRGRCARRRAPVVITRDRHRRFYARNNSQKTATSCEATYWYYSRWILPGVYMLNMFMTILVLNFCHTG
jgi:hypothetical protein